jgi:hypothetical protein
MCTSMRERSSVVHLVSLPHIFKVSVKQKLPRNSNKNIDKAWHKTMQETVIEYGCAGISDSVCEVSWDEGGGGRESTIW